MGLLFFLLALAYIIYKLADEASYNNCNAHDVDHRQFLVDANKISKSELKRRYKSGYYNKR